MTHSLTGNKTSPDLPLLSAAILISLVMVVLLPGMYFHKDLEVFWKWSQIWRENWRNIYSACPDCNYPILGMFGSAGMLGLFSPAGFDGAVFAYRLFLGILDGLNVLLIYWILKRLAVARPAYLAGIIGLSVSSWAGGALWGQIDGISQFFILLTLAWMVHKNTSAQPAAMPYWLYLFISAILLACILLTKQLAVFCALSLGLLLATDILFHSRGGRAFVQYSCLTAASLAGLIFVWDFFIQVKPPYLSHLFYIWKEGVFQSGLISGNGFNIWMLLGRDMWSSAHVPVFANIPLISPYLSGEIIFIVLAATISLSLGLWLRVPFQRGEKKLDRETLLNFVLYLALINLCFNVFLTGTRDRYLFHFYPYALLAWAGLGAFKPSFSEKGFSFLVLGTNFYGLFIFIFLTTIDFGLGTWPNIFLAIFHLGLSVYLLLVTLEYQGFGRSMSLIFKRKPKNLPTVR